MDDCCFICCENDGTKVYRVCLCQQVVHEECFRTMVEKVESHGGKCPVCLHVYSTTWAIPTYIVIRNFCFSCLAIAWGFWIFLVMQQSLKFKISITFFLGCVWGATCGFSMIQSKTVIRDARFQQRFLDA